VKERKKDRCWLDHVNGFFVSQKKQVERIYLYRSVSEIRSTKIIILDPNYHLFLVRPVTPLLDSPAAFNELSAIFLDKVSGEER
jgi:hypothetical protein